MRTTGFAASRIVLRTASGTAAAAGLAAASFSGCGAAACAGAGGVCSWAAETAAPAAKKARVEQAVTSVRRNMQGPPGGKRRNAVERRDTGGATVAPPRPPDVN